MCDKEHPVDAIKREINFCFDQNRPERDAAVDAKKRLECARTTASEVEEVIQPLLKSAIAVCKSRSGIPWKDVESLPKPIRDANTFGVQCKAGEVYQSIPYFIAAIVAVEPNRQELILSVERVTAAPSLTPRNETKRIPLADQYDLNAIGEWYRDQFAKYVAECESRCSKNPA